MAKQVMISIKREDLPIWEKFCKKVSNGERSQILVKLVKIYQFEGFPKIDKFSEIKKFYRIYNAWKNGSEMEEVGNDKPDLVKNGSDYRVIQELQELEKMV